MTEHELNAIRWYATAAVMAVAAVVCIVAGWQP